MVFYLNLTHQKIILYNEIINNLGDREINRILALDSESRSDLDKYYLELGHVRINYII